MKVGFWLCRRRPVCALRRLETSAFSELEALLSDVIPIVESNYRTKSMFEHGAAAKASAVGCGVDHAHLHLVPVECDLQSGAQQIAPNVRWSRVGSFKAISDQDLTRHGYWFCNSLTIRVGAISAYAWKENPQVNFSGK